MKKFITAFIIAISLTACNEEKQVTQPVESIQQVQETAATYEKDGIIYNAKGEAIGEAGISEEDDITSNTTMQYTHGVSIGELKDGSSELVNEGDVSSTTKTMMAARGFEFYSSGRVHLVQDIDTAISRMSDDNERKDVLREMKQGGVTQVFTFNPVEAKSSLTFFAANDIKVRSMEDEPQQVQVNVVVFKGSKSFMVCNAFVDKEVSNCTEVLGTTPETATNIDWIRSNYYQNYVKKDVVKMDGN